MDFIFGMGSNGITGVWFILVVRPKPKSTVRKTVGAKNNGTLEQQIADANPSLDKYIELNRRA
ncbi:MAG: hypothetical protein E4H26_01220 [Flavobacteriales bacterium]|nr:MAG: hypothetical protein E4H26_01220 [Flavobacteriales bacterium]